MPAIYNPSDYGIEYDKPITYQDPVQSYLIQSLTPKSPSPIADHNNTKLNLLAQPYSSPPPSKNNKVMAYDI